MYKSTAASENAPAIKIAGYALRENDEKIWRHRGADHHMAEFDAEKIAALLENIKNSDGGQGCQANVKHTPVENKPYIRIVTSYDAVEMVLPHIECIAHLNKLVLYDSETGKSKFRSSPVENGRIMMCKRANEIKQSIQKTQCPVRSIRKLEQDYDFKHIISYVVTINRDERSFYQRTESFIQCLRDNLEPGEKLICENKFFSICGDWYIINFCFEGYKKQPTMIGYMSNSGIVMYEQLNRMGCEAAFRYIDKQGDSRIDILARMNVEEFCNDYPNPAERLIKSIKLEQELRKIPFAVCYTTSDMGYGGDIIFHRVIEEYDGYEPHQISCLQIDDYDIYYILPAILEFYPYFNHRYYAVENHLPEQMIDDICERLEELKAMMFEDWTNPEFVKYAEKCMEHARIQEDPAEYMHKNRHNIAKLQNLFIDWCVKQNFGCGEYMINKQKAKALCPGFFFIVLFFSNSYTFLKSHGYRNKVHLHLSASHVRFFVRFGILHAGISAQP